MIRGYSKGEYVDITRFKDDLNALIMNVDFKIELKSVLNQLIGERVVDHIDDGTPRNATLAAKTDPKMLPFFKALSREIVCGLYVKDADAMNWFPRFGTFKKGSLTSAEFKQAVE